MEHKDFKVVEITQRWDVDVRFPPNWERAFIARPADYQGSHPLPVHIFPFLILQFGGFPGKRNGPTSCVKIWDTKFMEIVHVDGCALKATGEGFRDEPVIDALDLLHAYRNNLPLPHIL